MGEVPFDCFVHVICSSLPRVTCLRGRTDTIPVDQYRGSFMDVREAADHDRWIETEPVKENTGSLRSEGNGIPGFGLSPFAVHGKGQTRLAGDRGCT